jgi:hypothetical protein
MRTIHVNQADEARTGAHFDYMRSFNVWSVYFIKQVLTCLVSFDTHQYQNTWLWLSQCLARQQT